jgi:hypothetical protein
MEALPVSVRTPVHWVKRDCRLELTLYSGADHSREFGGFREHDPMARNPERVGDALVHIQITQVAPTMHISPWSVTRIDALPATAVPRTGMSQADAHSRTGKSTLLGQWSLCGTGRVY